MSNDQMPSGIEIERVFVIEGHYTPEAAERRPAVRSEHLIRAAELKREGVIVEGGAYADGLTSSLLLVRAADEASALAIAREDVYVRSGVWARSRSDPSVVSRSPPTSLRAPAPAARGETGRVAAPPESG